MVNAYDILNSFLLAVRTSAPGGTRRSLDESDQFIRSIADNLPGMIGYWDLELRCRFANLAYLNGFGRTPEEMIGIHLCDLLGEELFRAHQAFIAGALGGERQSFGQTLAQSDSTLVHTWATYLPDLVDGEVRGFYVLITDVTDLKLAELRLTALNNELSRRAAEAEAATRAKSDFLTNMSHEIRTPMNAVLGLAQVGLRDSVGSAAQPTFQRIIDAGQHLLAIINDILDFSKIEAGRLVVEKAPFVIGEAVDRAIGLTALRAYAKDLEFRVIAPPDLPEMMTGDAMRLTQVLVNLLSNAIKFTEQGVITLQLASQDNELSIRIVDTGIGMTPEQVARVFDPFEQADGSTTRRFGGTGLGLTISKRIVEAMGGSIEVLSRLDEGTCFALRLPGLATSRPAASPPFGSVRLVGLAESEVAALASDLLALGIAVDVASAERALTLPPVDRLVIAADAVPRLAPALPANGLLMVVTTPGVATARPDLPPGRMVGIERPLRSRHILRPFHDGDATTPFPANRLAGWHILAAEDNDINRLVLGDILAREGATVTFASDGSQALQRIEEQGVSAFDLVLMDVQMPVMDGLTATRYLRALAPALPVIGLTAHAFPEEHEKCLAAGMMAQVTKPIDVDTLVATILGHAGGRPGTAPAPAANQPVPLPGEPAGGTPASVPLVDWAALAKRFQGQPAFADQLMQVVLDTYRDTPAKLRAAAGSHDVETIAAIAHKLRGTAGTIEANGLMDLASRVEKCRQSPADDPAALAEQLAELLAQVCAEVAGHPPMAAAPADPASRPALCLVA